MFDQHNITEFAREELVSKSWKLQVSEKEGLCELKAFMDFGRVIEEKTLLFSHREILKFRGLTNIFKNKFVTFEKFNDDYKAVLPVDILPETFNNEEEAGSYLRGAFLIAGYLSLGKQGYHLEIVAPKDKKELVQEAVRIIGIELKSYQRRGKKVYYLKNLDTIIHFLVAIGAMDTALFCYEAAMRRQVRNQTQVLVNYDIANTFRSIRASSRQKNKLEKMLKEGKLDGLPKALKEIAEARLQFPEHNLEELAKEMNLTRSAVNHRLRRIMRWK